ncbi:manganese-dependent inorganic pyrophosphatase [Lacticaseibacillus manihotivorans]|uniref:inorganic diphosphatase n=2 Tax=Lacticaseibacillus manihotivorans TaxID=88233 RepID=A0A0R1R7M4_9LACO|nr:manganese-dependent inorganic pyrophosphatase [Lacticaseibacillus manihotivorans]KRL50810.1 inorganic pyrophosphatase exopolyphosphatase [Lacticaseibacillus manihotivorans DSM 13343 = JCM 12514]QFQ91482.1 manganese-dependent inorganic pyrophosphatase [Lacticaseibacillus manihotivorans]
MTTLIFGHQNPDTDAITSAITWAEFQRQSGNTDVEAVALGTPNDETKFALDTFKTQAPRVIDAANGADVMLVDHNEAQQSVADRKDSTIVSVVDHHRFANFETAAPLFIRAEPVGSCNSIIYKMYKENGFEITPQIAALMLSGAISDTLLLKSPTTTDLEREILPELAKIAGVDLQEYGLNMLKAGTNLAAKSDLDITEGDAKSFDMGGKTVRIGQVNVVDLEEIYARQADIEASLKAESERNGYDLFLLVATDILNSNSTGLAFGEGKDKLEAAFGGKFDADDRLALPGVVSRKKQVVPPLQKAFEA